MPSPRPRTPRHEQIPTGLRLTVRDTSTDMEETTTSSGDDIQDLVAFLADKRPAVRFLFPLLTLLCLWHALSFTKCYSLCLVTSRRHL